MRTRLSHHLSRTWGHLLPESFLEIPVDESTLNCSQCPKSPRAPFKCCDYWPYIPNFRVTRDIRSRIPKDSLWPFGIMAPRSFQIQRQLDLLSPDLKCPFYRLGRCEIWSTRPAICSSYFCQSQAGESGEVFWTNVSHFLNEVEQTLAAHWMLEAGYEWREIEALRRALFLQDARSEVEISQVLRPETAWAHHWGNRDGFFDRACAWSDSLNASDVEKMWDQETADHLNRVLNQALLMNQHSLTNWRGTSRSSL